MLKNKDFFLFRNFQRNHWNAAPFLDSQNKILLWNTEIHSQIIQMQNPIMVVDNKNMKIWVRMIIKIQQSERQPQGKINLKKKK